jgi:hypothetical protein
MTMLSTEFWVVFQIVTILLLLFLLVYFIRHSRRSRNETDEQVDMSETARKWVDLMEPLLEEAESSARIFEQQILEKKRLIHDLNNKLDSRIISLNLLLNRADAFLAQPMGLKNGQTLPTETIHDTQESILDLFRKGVPPQDIAETLSVSGQEVALVIALKKKFIAMEKGS